MTAKHVDFWLTYIALTILCAMVYSRLLSDCSQTQFWGVCLASAWLLNKVAKWLTA